MSRELAELILNGDNEEDKLRYIEFGDMVLSAIHERLILEPEGWSYSCRVRDGIVFFPNEVIKSKGSDLVPDDGSPVIKGREYTGAFVLIMDAPPEMFKNNPFLELGTEVEVQFVTHHQDE